MFSFYYQLLLLAIKNLQRAVIRPISFSVQTSLNLQSTSCVRCSSYTRPTVHQHGIHLIMPNRGKHVCHQCDAAGDLDCIFSPAIRFTSTHVDTSCVCCTIHHKKCTFENEYDVKCTRCQERKTLCRFRISGKDIILTHIIYSLRIV